MHEHTQPADVHGDRETRKGGDTGEGSGTMRWRVDIWMPKVKSMVLSAVFLLSPPPPPLPPLSPVEISHFLQAQCWFHTGARGLEWESVRWVWGGEVWGYLSSGQKQPSPLLLSAKNIKMWACWWRWVFFTYPTITHTSASGRGHSTTPALYQSKTCSFGVAGLVSCTKAPSFSPLAGILTESRLTLLLRVLHCLLLTKTFIHLLLHFMTSEARVAASALSWPMAKCSGLKHCIQERVKYCA